MARTPPPYAVIPRLKPEIHDDSLFIHGKCCPILEHFTIPFGEGALLDPAWVIQDEDGRRLVLQSTPVDSDRITLKLLTKPELHELWFHLQQSSHPLAAEALERLRRSHVREDPVDEIESLTVEPGGDGHSCNVTINGQTTRVLEMLELPANPEDPQGEWEPAAAILWEREPLLIVTRPNSPRVLRRNEVRRILADLCDEAQSLLPAGREVRLRANALLDRLHRCGFGPV